MLDSDGHFGGSLGFLTDLREPLVVSAMHDAIERGTTAEEMLHAVERELMKLVEFDSLRVSVISHNREHLRPLYPVEQEDPALRLRWWQIRPYVHDFIDEETTKDVDIDELFSREGYKQQAKSDPATAAWLARGYKRVLSIPVNLGERVCALISLERRRPESFGQEVIERCERLPLVEAALTAMRHDENERLRMMLELIEELGKASDEIRRVAKVLVDRLAHHFGWQHVAVFQLDENTRTGNENKRAFRVLQQASRDGKFLPEGFAIPEGRGIVWKAYTDESGIVNAPDVRAEKFSSAYVRAISGVVSELSMRVPAEHSRWVLNVESNTENAFAAEEIETLSLLVREAGFILERAALLETRKAVLKAINDGVVETNETGRVREANPAAETLFGYKTGDLRDKMLADLVHDEETARLIAQPDELQRRETVIVRQDGQQVPILISGALMPDDLGGKVFVVSDLTYQKELHRIDLIKEVFRQAAFESKIPLSLAASYLSQIIEGRPATPELVEKTLKQLTKVDLPLERLLRLAAGNTTHDIEATAPLAQTIRHVLQELPDADFAQVDIHDLSSDARVPVGRDTLAFCVESMLSFAFRTRPLDRKVQIALKGHGDVADLCVRGEWSPLFNADATTDFADRWRQRAIVDLSLGGGLLEDVAKRAGGRFSWVIEEDAPLELNLALPLVRGGMR